MLSARFEINSRNFNIESSQFHAASFQALPSIKGQPPMNLRMSFNGWTPRSFILSIQITLINWIELFNTKLTDLHARAVEVFR